MTFEGVDENLVAKFRRFHEANSDIYGQFVNLAFQMKRTGRKKYSAWTIINKIRWDQDSSTTGDVFMINNDFIALYARMAMYLNSELEGFFEMRRMKPDDRRESGEERYRKQRGVENAG
jgi:hypothetical protein